MTYQKERARHEQMSCFFFCPFKSNIRETWRMILVSKADIFLSESLRILAERLSQSEIGLPLRQICYYSPPEVGVFSTEIKTASSAYSTRLPHNGDETLNIIEVSAEYDVCF